MYTSGPAGYEKVVMEKAVADHINALFLGREAYIQCESDKILKKTSKQRIYKLVEAVNQFFFQAEDGIRDLVRSRGLGDVYKRQLYRLICFTSTSSSTSLASHCFTKRSESRWKRNE